MSSSKGRVPSQEAFDHVDAIALHAQQVEAGLIPADAPPDFVLPQPLDDRGLPWWFGPDYHPTPEALAEFSKPLPGGPSAEETVDPGA